MYYYKADTDTEIYKEYAIRHECLVEKKFPAARRVARKYCIPEKDLGVYDLTLFLNEDSAAFQSDNINSQLKKSDENGWRALKKKRPYI